MFALVESNMEFSADDFYVKARESEIPPDLIKRFAGSSFKQFKAAGYIEKTDRYKLSERNGSTTLPIWTKAYNNKCLKVVRCNQQPF
jgi:hypothetical protein